MFGFVVSVDRLVVVERLAPCNEGQASESLGLEFESEVEVLQGC
jgi:hypothetical protein